MEWSNPLTARIQGRSGDETAAHHHLVRVGRAVDAIAYAIAALICFTFIITFPFGVAWLRIGILALWPFGKPVVKRADAGIASGIGNVNRRRLSLSSTTSR